MGHKERIKRIFDRVLSNQRLDKWDKVKLLTYYSLQLESAKDITPELSEYIDNLYDLALLSLKGGQK